MSTVLETMRVMPYYHQVAVQSEGATDIPTVETGEERLVASTEAIIIATRAERLGEVEIEVRRRDDLIEVPGTRVFDGELSFTTPRLQVGSAVANHLVTIDVGRIGWLPIQIYTDSPDEPHRVIVVVP